MADFLLSTPSLKAHWVEVEKEFLNNRIESILAMERKWAGGGKLVEFRDDEGQAQVAITPFGEAVVELLISVENRFGGVCEGLDDIKVDFQNKLVTHIILPYLKECINTFFPPGHTPNYENVKRLIAGLNAAEYLWLGALKNCADPNSAVFIKNAKSVHIFAVKRLASVFFSAKMLKSEPSLRSAFGTLNGAMETMGEVQTKFKNLSQNTLKLVWDCLIKMADKQAFEALAGKALDTSEAQTFEIMAELANVQQWCAKQSLSLDPKKMKLWSAFMFFMASKSSVDAVSRALGENAGNEKSVLERVGLSNMTNAEFMRFVGKNNKNFD